MAINFPSNPSNNAIFTDNNGQQWVYSSSDKSWTALGISVDPGGLQYQGGLNITAAPPSAASGQFWSVETGGAANAGFAPGVTGTIPEGSFVLYDGVNWELLETSSLWNRTGGLIQPVNQNDVIQTDSGLKVGPSGTPTIELKSDGSAEYAGPLGVGLPFSPGAVIHAKATGTSGATLAIFDDSGSTNTGRFQIDTTGGNSQSSLNLSAVNRRYLGLGQVGDPTLVADLGTENVLIGGTLPTAPNIELKSDGSATFAGDLRLGTSLWSNSDTGNIQIADTSPLINLRNNTVASDGDELGAIRALSCDSSGQYDNRNGAKIGFIAEDAPGSAQKTAVAFSTQSNAGDTNDFGERMRLDSSGDLLIGGTLPSAPNIRLKSDGEAEFNAGALKVSEDYLSVHRNGARKGYFGWPSPSNNDFQIFNEVSNGNVEIATNGTKRLTVKNTGNVLIGGTLPSAPNIELKSDGSAQFKGAQVDFGTSAGSRIRFARPNDGAYNCTLGYDLRLDAPSDNNKFGIVNNGGGAQVCVGLINQSTSKFSVQTLNSGTNLFEEVASISRDGAAQFSDTVTIDEGPQAGQQGGEIVLGKVGSESLATISSTRVDGSFKGNLEFKTHRNDSNTLTTALTLTSSQNAQFAGSVSIGGTAAANTIDEYEEGTWSVSVLDSNNQPLSGVTASEARYTKVGQLVVATVELEITPTTLGNNTFRITLPFGSISNSCRSVLIGSNTVTKKLPLTGITSGNLVLFSGAPTDVGTTPDTYRCSISFQVD